MYTSLLTDRRSPPGKNYHRRSREASFFLGRGYFSFGGGCILSLLLLFTFGYRILLFAVESNL